MLDRPTSQSRSFGRIIGTVAGGLIAFGLALGAPLAAAQEASPQASPATEVVEGVCVVPETAPDVVPSPETSPAASPAAEVAPVGTPLPGPMGDELAQAAANFVRCISDGELEAVANLATPNFLQTQFGITTAEELTAGMEGMTLPMWVLLTAENPQAYDDGRFSIDVQYRIGDYQVVTATHYFVQAGDQLLVDEEEVTFAEIEEDAVVLSVVVDEENVLAVAGVTTAMQLPAVIVQIRNDGTEVQRLQIVSLGEVDAATPVAEVEVPADAEFVGRAVVVPGDTVDVALVGLEVGSYAIVDPATGQQAGFTITPLEEEG